MTGHDKTKGDLRRTVVCPFCGGEHRRKSKEQRECRLRARRGKSPLPPDPKPEPSGARHAGAPTTHYETDALRGDKRAHGIERKARQGWTERKIAKHYGISVEKVREALEKLR